MAQARRDRIENDTMGEGARPPTPMEAQTQRAVENFPISGGTIDPLIHALAATRARGGRDARSRALPKARRGHRGRGGDGRAGDWDDIPHRSVQTGSEKREQHD